MPLGTFCVCTRRRNATRRLPRLSGLTPFVVVFSAAQQPCRERRLPIALPRRAPCAPVTVRTQALDSFAPRVSLSSASSVLYGSTPPASLLVEDGRRPDDDVVICVVSPLGTPQKRGHSSRTAYNDPSAGSPTETLLRLLLPLDAGARRTSGRAEARPPDNSPQHPIGRSDGRCVQRAGTHSARDH